MSGRGGRGGRRRSWEAARRQRVRRRRTSYRDGWPRYCIATIAVPDRNTVAARIVLCRRERGHDGRHAAPQVPPWTDEESAAMDELWAAHNGGVRGRLPYEPRPAKLRPGRKPKVG